MTNKKVAMWKTALSRQQFAVLEMIENRTRAGQWTRYRHLFRVANSPTKRISELTDNGIRLETRSVQIRNATGQKVYVTEMKTRG